MKWYAWPVEPLGPDERWVEHNGRPIREKTGPKTGEKRYIVSDSCPSGSEITLFRVQVDRTGRAEILADTDLSRLSQGDLECTPRATR